ncbi:hypothetical protein [Amycolatopsis methanolica]|uniref:hypothetical protein n=1 Tax=Amycolatopsis methanolica TaxID=1814 RepID=UPI0012DFFC97|nr:hypothetical protein [Amycolatopsis methanolica]
MPSFAQILSDSDGAPLPDITGIAGRFEFGYALSKADAKKAADDFLSSVQLAGFINNAGDVTLSGAEHSRAEETSAADVAESALNPPVMGDTLALESETSETPEIADSDIKEKLANETYAPISRRSESLPLQISVTIDMSDWTPTDVISVLKTLGYGQNND